MELERKSEAVQAGTLVPISTSSTVVLDADDADLAAKFFIGNVSDEPITIRYAADGAEVDEGIVLQPNSVLEEDRYAGPVCAVHGGTGNKNLSLVIV